MLAHRNNLLRKRQRDLNGADRALLTRAEQAYSCYIDAINFADISAGKYTASVGALERYLGVAKRIERSSPTFNWRSDFAGSIIPEFVYMCVHSVLHGAGVASLFSTRESVVEITQAGGGVWDVRKKNQDLTVGLDRAKIESRRGVEEFVVPLLAYEIKTNTDRNKLAGLNFSAERLKRTFPGARYFLVTETVDFSLQNCYASGAIDEVYVLRKQLRSNARRKLKPLDPDVFGLLFAATLDVIDRARIGWRHVYERLDDGRLIGGR
jgi:hypothetical protein